jgi:hypothetical protein
VVDAAAGLTTAEAQLRLARDGPNAIVDVSQHPVWRAIKKLWAPVPWMLEAAIVIQLGLNDAAADSDHRVFFWVRKHPCSYFRWRKIRSVPPVHDRMMRFGAVAFLRERARNRCLTGATVLSSRWIAEQSGKHRNMTAVLQRRGNSGRKPIRSRSLGGRRS